MNKKVKKRLDHLLVERGLVENTSKAKARIMAGDVIVNEHRYDKPGIKFREDVSIRLRRDSLPYVSRGGLKLEHALKTWPFSIDGKICIDVGASTGGFCDVLLKNNALKVYAVDVGYGQLAERIRTDDRIVNLERTHILNLSSKDLKDRPSIAVVDVSFISIKKIFEHLLSLLKKPARIYLLIKPQFEAGYEHVEKGGLVKNEKIHVEIIKDIKAFIETHNGKVLGVDKSPIKGAKGNVEYVMAVDFL